ncbi:MAG: ribonuclease R [Flavobacteriales bacterium]
MKNKDTLRKYRALKKRILLFLGHSSPHAYNHKQIAKKIGAGPKEKSILPAVLDELFRGKLLEKKDKGKYFVAAATHTVEGKISIAVAGYAFVSTADFNRDIFISKTNIHGAFPDDLVRVSLLKKKFKGRPRGKVLGIVKRARETYSGTLHIKNGKFLLLGDQVKIPMEIYIKDVPGSAGAGDKVAARIVDWQGYGGKPLGVIERHLGKAGQTDAEINAILIDAGFDVAFPDEIRQYANGISGHIAPAEFKKRRDFRNVPTFTIDPADAKDFDDAISIRTVENGKYEIGVHIADVSHYVKENKLLDREAQKRGTSVYLANKVCPMLPEKLSNEVCSLRPKEDKLCFSVVFRATKDGRISDPWIGKTVINSDRRFSYEEAGQNLKRRKGEFAEELGILKEITEAVRKQRISAGGIGFESSEVKIEFDNTGFPVGFSIRQQGVTNRIVEELMLMANKTVAEYLGKRKSPAVPLIYRVHDKPDEVKIESFKRFIKGFGYSFKTGKKEQASKSLNRLMKQIKGRREEFIINQLAIRTMAKASYSTDNIGHYGLGFSHYCHFTSPIRRYPDLVVHRLLQHFLEGNKAGEKMHLEAISKHCTEREISATAAERTSVRFFQALFLNNHIGEVFSGIVSGISEWGFYVEFDRSKCEGMVRFRDMEGDYYYADDDNHNIVGFNNKRKIRLGDSVKVKVKKVDVIQKKVDLTLLS